MDVLVVIVVLALAVAFVAAPLRRGAAVDEESSEANRRARFYRLTTAGVRRLEEERADWDRVAQVAHDADVRPEPGLPPHQWLFSESPSRVNTVR